MSMSMYKYEERSMLYDLVCQASSVRLRREMGILDLGSGIVKTADVIRRSQFTIGSS
jgi:hypothetical protein